MPLEGVNPELQAAFRRIKGLPVLLDTIQYSSLPLSVNSLSSSSGLSSSATSRAINKLLKSGIRARADYNLLDLDLKLVVMEIDARWRPEEDGIPLRHWISSALATLNGTILLVYRVPKEMSLSKVVRRVRSKLGKTRILYIEEYTHTMMAKPSYQYYMESLGGDVNPKTALKVVHEHPRNEYNRLETLTKPRRPPGYRVTKDLIDLIILSMAEIDALTLKRRLYRLLHLQTPHEYRVKAEKHIVHANKIVRGTRIMATDKENNVLLGIGVRGDQKCIEDMTKMMLVYFYAYSIAHDSGKAFYVVSIPYKYIHDLATTLNDMCNLDSTGKEIKLIPLTMKGFITRMTVPYRNYEFLTKSWVTDERILDKMEEKIKKKYPVDKL